MSSEPLRFRATLVSGAQVGERIALILHADHSADVTRLLPHLGEQFAVLMIESSDQPPEPAVGGTVPEQLPM